MPKNQLNNVAERAKIGNVNVFCAYDEIVETQKLIPNPNNPNMHPDEQIKLLADIIERTGWRAPITVSTRSGYIVKGHGRLMAAKKAGLESVPVEYQNFNSDDEEKAALLADNKIAEFSEIDNKLLSQMFEGFNFEEYGDLTGYSDNEYKELMSVIDEVEEIADPNTIITPPEKGTAFTKLGDIWELGRHRLICGDSQNIEVYQSLMNEEIADIVMTDPPYNVDYEGGTGLKIANDNLSDSDFYHFLLDCFTPMSKFLKPGGAVYCWHADSERINFQRALEFAGILIKQTLIWVKNSFVLCRQDYQWKHESCLYGWKEGAAHYFIDKRNLSTVTNLENVDIDALHKDELKELIKKILDTESTILEYDRPQKSILHPTMKPVELFIDGIENSSRPGQIVLDNFGGSGTTIIACEKTGRIARLIELSPEYCDAIVKRYLTIFANAKVKCIRNGNEITSPLKAIE